MFLIASTSFATRNFITTYFDLDLKIYIEFLMAILPSVIASQLFVAISEIIFEKDTMNVSSSKPSSSSNHIFLADRARGNNANTGGSGSNNGGASGSRNNPIVIRSPSPEDEAAVRARATRPTNNLGTGQGNPAQPANNVPAGPALPANNAPAQPGNNVPAGPALPANNAPAGEVVIPQPAYTLEHVPGSRFPLLNITDPTNIGARGFINPNNRRPYATSQPYAKNLAAGLASMRAPNERGSVAMCWQNLDANATRFIHEYLYTYYPTRRTNGSVYNSATFRKELSNLN